MGSPGMSRMLAVGSVMSAATAFRVGATSLTLWSEQAPKLMELWLKAEEDEDKAGTKLRDEVFTTARDAAERINIELVGGINDADRFTKPRSGTPAKPQSRTPAKTRPRTAANRRAEPAAKRRPGAAERRPGPAAKRRPGGPPG